MAVEVVLPKAGFAVTRRWPRYRVDLPVRVIKQRRNRLVAIEARGAELNAGGMSVLAVVELAIGAQVTIEFKPPYSLEPIRARCFVRNRKGYTYGLEFIDELAEIEAK